MTLDDYIYALPSKVDLFLEEEEIDGGHHDLDDGDEGCSEDRPLLLHAPRHYQVRGSRPNNPLHAQFDCKVNHSTI